MNKFIRVLLQTSAITAVSITSASAQDVDPLEVEEIEETQAPFDTARDGDDEIVVTGSRIRRDEFSSPVSIDVLTVDDARIEGIADISGLLQTATAASGSNQVTSAISTAFVVNGGLGAETVGLRGLAANRTLDLINGRRAGPSGTRGSVSSFDLGSIPLLGIERVDILKDGASSIYGSDAIAGVINYVTNKSDGAEVDLFTSIPEDGGGEVFRASATYGDSFERGRFRITGDYIKEEELARRDRDYLDCDQSYSFTDASLSTRADVIDPRTGEPQCAGTIWGHVWVYDYGSDNIIRNPRNLIFQFDYPGDNLGSFLPAIPSGDLRTPAGWYQVEYTQDQIDANPLYGGVQTNNAQNAATNLYPEMESRNSVIPERERFTLMGDFDFEITDSITAYGEALFNRRQTYQNGIKQYWTYQYGASNTVFGGGPLPNSPYQGWDSDFAWFSPTSVVEHGDQETTIDYFRLVGGLRGDFGDNSPLDGWEWDVYAQHSDSHGEYWEQFVRQDSISLSNNVTFSGTPSREGSCVGETSSGATGEDGADISGVPCVDVRWFDPAFLAGELTEGERGFLLTEDTGFTDYTQTTVEGFVTGDLLKLPYGMMSVALGAFYQNDEILDRPSDTILSGNGFQESNAGITEGSQSSTAFYGEASLPLLRDLPLAEQVNATVSARYTGITSKTVDGREVTEDGFNYRATLDWVVNPTVRFRGSLGTSFRAPGLFEQFLADESSSIRQSLIDPCIGWQTALDQGDIQPITAQNCQADGIPGDYAGAPIAAQILQGGGFGVLTPEKSENFTVGFVLSPDFADVSLAVDYFNIKIEDEISTLSAGQIVSGCYSSQNFATEPLCDLFNRGIDATGAFRIDTVRASFININSQENEGLDFTGRYRTDTRFGDLVINTQWSHQIKDEVQLLAEDAVQFLNGGIGEPKWTGIGNVTLSPNDKISLRYSFDFIGKQNALRDRFDETEDFSDQLAADGGFTVNQDGQTVYWKTKAESMFYHAISAQYAADGDWTFRAGVNNIFDEAPPALSTQNTFGNSPLSSQYDLRGRRFFLNVSKKFR
ncbi:MAG: TonB-dependent receptor [Litorimonas sp.]